jgi:hypothetical protein
MKLSMTVIVFLAAACGDRIQGDTFDDGGGIPDAALACDPIDPERCNDSCDSQDDCGSFLYCGPEGRCRAECTPTGGECGEGADCLHGECVQDCPSVTVDLSPVTPTVVLLIDQSGSMDQDFGGVRRWDAVVDALGDRDHGVVFALEDRVRFGVSLYTSHNGTLGDETCPLLTQVSTALGNAEAIKTLLDGNTWDGDTPTGESLTVTAAQLAALPGGMDPKVIVLATDGEPDTCAEPNPQHGQDESVAAAQEAFRSGVRTYVLSVGNDVSDGHLQDLANAGVGLDPDGAENAPFYRANNAPALVAAFEDIIRGVRSCSMTLDGAVGPGGEVFGTVELNGARLTYGEGWTMPDASTIELLGSACQTFLDDDTVTVEAFFACGVVIE